ncbi:MAG: PAS domain S-box protein [Bacteroidota bacterium]
MDITSRILLLNNKPQLAHDLQQYLLREYSHVDCLHESSRAFSRLAGGQYDLLVLSNHLNDMEGIDFIRLLKKEAVSVPFVMIAGDTDIRQAVEVMKEGAEEFLQWSDDTQSFFPYITEVVRKAVHQNVKNRFFSDKEMLYQTLFENLRDAVFLHLVDEETGLPGPFVEVNQVARRRLGYTEQEFAGMTPADIDEPGVVNMNKVMSELFKRGSTIIKTRHVAKDGRKIPTEINSRLFDFKGKKAVLSVARNISSQEKVLEELKNSELRFRSIIEKCIIGICITDENGFFEYVNDEYCRIYNYDPEEMLGKHFTMVVPEESKQMLSELHEDFINNGREMKGDWTVVDKHGHKRFVVADAARITETNGRYRKVTFVEDVTSEKWAQQELELSEAKYRGMMENLQDPVFISDKDYRIIYVNKAFKKRFGEISNNTKCYRQVFGEEKPCPWCLDAVHNMSKFRKRLEKTINNRVYQITTAPISFQNQYEAKMTIMRDVTKIVKARHKAQESDRLKSAFLANISHEIRTPLNAVLGFANLLKDESITRDETMMYVDMINESSNHLLQVIDNIIEFSFIDSGLVNVKSVKIEPQQFLDELHREIGGMQRKMEKDYLQVTTYNQLPDGFNIFSDDVRLKQILINLLSNAVKFTERGGVTLSVFYTENKWVVFSVKDTGIGIPEEKHEVIFRRFRQGDESRTRMFGGNGLGLALSKHLAQMLGGHITVDSEPGKGSEFRLFIPEILDESLARALSVDFVR